MVFERPSDPPEVFRSDGRGKAARTDEAYARLALSYLAAPKGERRGLSERWSAQFGRHKHRWQADLRRARGFCERDPRTGELMLSAQGEMLVLGLDDPEFWHAIGDAESRLIAADDWITLVLNAPGADPVLRAHQINQVRAYASRRGESFLAALKRLVAIKRGELSSSEAFFYPDGSRETPKESWEQSGSVGNR